VADATIAVDRLQTLQVTRDLTAQVTLEYPFMLGDQVKDLVQLLFGQILSPHVGVQACFLDEQVGPGRADAVDITKGIRDFFLRGNVDAEETRHGVVLVKRVWKENSEEVRIGKWEIDTEKWNEIY